MADNAQNLSRGITGDASELLQEWRQPKPPHLCQTLC